MVDARRLVDGLRDLVLGKSPVTAADLHAGGQTAQIPFPGTAGGLVEVVEVEDETAFGREEEAEVVDVCIAHGLHVEAGGYRARQVGGHDGGPGAVEGERGGAHTLVPDGQQFRDAAALILPDLSKRVRPTLLPGQRGLAAAGHGLTQRLSLCEAHGRVLVQPGHRCMRKKRMKFHGSHLRIFAYPGQTRPGGIG